MDRGQIETLAGMWGVEVLQAGTKEVKMRCPFPGCEHRAFTVEVSENVSRCYCFACTRGGLLAYVAQELAQLAPSQVAAANYVRQHDTGIYVPKTIETPERSIRTDAMHSRLLHAGKGRVSKAFAKQLLPKEITKWSLAYDPAEERDLFPVFDTQNRLRGITGRRTRGDQELKYFHYGSAKAMSAVFYGEQFIDTTHREAILVEGTKDVIKASRYLPNVLGLLGANILTRERINRLKRWFTVLTLMLDADEAGYLAMCRIGVEMLPMFTVFVSVLPEGTDPWDASPEDLKRAYRERVLWALIPWEMKGGEKASRILQRLKRQPHSRRF